jgi:hypothetical protein
MHVILPRVSWLDLYAPSAAPHAFPTFNPPAAHRSRCPAGASLLAYPGAGLRREGVSIGPIGGGMGGTAGSSKEAYSIRSEEADSSPRRGTVTTKSCRHHPKRAMDALCDFQ